MPVTQTSMSHSVRFQGHEQTSELSGVIGDIRVCPFVQTLLHHNHL